MSVNLENAIIKGIDIIDKTKEDFETVRNVLEDNTNLDHIYEPYDGQFLYVGKILKKWNEFGRVEISDVEELMKDTPSNEDIKNSIKELLDIDVDANDIKTFVITYYT